jgi:hypothetical protein
MEREPNPCHFWLGIESDYDEAEWHAHVRRGLEQSRAAGEPVPQPAIRVTASTEKIVELLPG